MYSTCLFCHAPFGENREIEHLPTGRRIAYDQARGRLWVVCRYCARWNLTPFDDRWEAIEECERRFRDTRVRVSSSNVGLARLDEGLELVRIGHPLRPEFAAWRYGRQLQRRRQWRFVRAAAAAGRHGLLFGGPALAMVAHLVVALAYTGLAAFVAVRLRERPALRIPLGGGEELQLSAVNVQDALLVRDETVTDGWSLMVDHIAPPPDIRWLRLHRRFDQQTVLLTGPEARLVTTLLLPRLNQEGGNEETVSDAVRWLEAAGGPDHAFHTFARARLVRPALDSVRTTFATMHAGVRLALEMALHEEEEGRALRGELSVLRWAWEYEERLAEIADGIAVPDWIERELAALRSRG